MALALHILGANAAAAELSEPCFSRFRLEEDTVVFDVAAGGAHGCVNISLHERSRYPRTGALAFAEGSDVLLDAVKGVSEGIAERGALDAVLVALAAQLGGAAPALAEQLPAYVGACGGGDNGGPSSSGSAAVDEAPDGESGGEDDGMCSDDMYDDQYDNGFAEGDELDAHLVRLRLSWEQKDATRRAAAMTDLHGADGTPDDDADNAPSSSDPSAAPGSEGKAVAAEAKRRGEAASAAVKKRGAAAQIFSAAEAMRILCNELAGLIRERAEGFEVRISMHLSNYLVTMQLSIYLSMNPNPELKRPSINSCDAHVLQRTL